MLSSSQYHVEDVGRILLHVQSQLQSIRSTLATGESREDAKEELLRSLDRVLFTAETDLRAKAELVLNATMNDDVATLPPSGSAGPQSHHQVATHPPHSAGSGASPERKLHSRVRQRVEQARRLQLLTNPGAPTSREYIRQRFGLPVVEEHARVLEEQHSRVQRARQRKTEWTTRVVHHPTSEPAGVGPLRADSTAHTTAIHARELSKGMYNLVERGFVPAHADLTPAFQHGAATLQQRPALVHDPTVKLVRAQPRMEQSGFNAAALRLDVTTPHPIRAARIGRRIVRAPPPSGVHPTILGTFHSQLVAESHALAGAGARPGAGAGAGPTLRTTGIQFPAGADPQIQAPAAPASSQPAARRVASAATRPGSGGSVLHSDASGGADDEEALRSAMNRIRGYNELLDTYSLHQFIIRKGHALRMTPEFLSYQRTHESQWGVIARVITALEALLLRHGINMAYIDGQAVARLAVSEVRAPGTQELLACVVNREEVETVVRAARSRFAGPHGRREAATLIQACWRMRLQRRIYLSQKERLRAVLVIQRRVRLFLTVLEFARRMAEHRRTEEERFMGLQATLRDRWPAIRQKRRVALHIPSFSKEPHIRLSTPNLALKQNSQLERLVAVADPLVDVVYVSPYPLPDEVLAYYKRLLQIGGVPDADSRLTVIVPENVDRFAPHLSLTTQLLLSPRALRRVKHFTRGREAYIVPGDVGPEEKHLALWLGLPMLGAHPELAAVVSTKSGAKRIFAQADANMPPSAYDLYAEEDVVLALARLIARHPSTEKWLVKLDDESGGRGTAYFESRVLPSVADIRREFVKHSARDPTYWEQPEVQAGTRDRLVPELRRALPRRLVLACPLVYCDYGTYMAALARVGAVVEACAPEVRGSPSANLFIDPRGRVHVTSTHDQIFDAPFRFAGCAFPQQSVPPEAMLGAATAIGAALFSKGVLGYVGVDFVAWFDEEAQALRLWAVDLNLRVTPSAATFALFNFLMGGRFDALSGKYLVVVDDGADGSGTGMLPIATGATGMDTVRVVDGDALGGGGGAEDSASVISALTSARSSGGQSAASLAPRLEPRHYVAFPYLTHSGLCVMQYGTFFSQCRMGGVSFDLKRRVGTTFLLLDSLTAATIGAICVAHVPLAALQIVGKLFSFLESQLGPRPDAGEFDAEESNFPMINQTVRSMLRAIERAMSEG